MLIIKTQAILIRSDSDGLIKLWTIKSSECVRTLDEHSDKVKNTALVTLR